MALPTSWQKKRHWFIIFQDWYDPFRIPEVTLSTTESPSLGPQPRRRTVPILTGQCRFVPEISALSFHRDDLRKGSYPQAEELFAAL